MGRCSRHKRGAGMVSKNENRTIVQYGAGLFESVRCPTFTELQRGSWRGDVSRGGACKVTPHPEAIHQSIDCPLYLIFYFYFGFTLMRPTWLTFVVEDRLLGG